MLTLTGKSRCKKLANFKLCKQKLNSMIKLKIKVVFKFVQRLVD
jgi:hypothetical protein